MTKRLEKALGFKLKASNLPYTLSNFQILQIKNITFNLLRSAYFLKK